jgi:hypothetical protein
MAPPLRPMAVFAQRRRTTLIGVSETLTQQLPMDFVSDSANNLRSSLRCLRVRCLATLHWLVSRGNADMTLSPLVETKYGLRLEISHGTSLQISKRPQKSTSSTQILGTAINTSNLHLQTLGATKSCPETKSPVLTAYRLLPDWQTSYLWYNEGLLQHPLEDPHVGVDIIRERYPLLAPLYLEWHDIYENAFERQECHLGRNINVFPRVDEQVAWETEGFLIACWLALQDDV